MRLMRHFLSSEFIGRIIFTTMVIGVLLAGVAAGRWVSIALELSRNEAAQIHESGGEVTVETKSQAQSLMAADIERRRLLADQSSMLSIGGVGLALIGLGWLLRDLLGGRRRKAANKSSAASSSCAII